VGYDVDSEHESSDVEPGDFHVVYWPASEKRGAVETHGSTQKAKGHRTRYVHRPKRF